jgi:hypothetical protein
MSWGPSRENAPFASRYNLQVAIDTRLDSPFNVFEIAKEALDSIVGSSVVSYFFQYYQNGGPQMTKRRTTPQPSPDPYAEAVVIEGGLIESTLLRLCDKTLADAATLTIDWFDEPSFGQNGDEWTLGRANVNSFSGNALTININNQPLQSHIFPRYDWRDTMVHEILHCLGWEHDDEYSPTCSMIAASRLASGHRYTGNLTLIPQNPKIHR